METKNYKIFSEIKEIQSTYEGGSLEKIPGLYRSQYQVIKMCEYYSDSRYLQQNGEGTNLDEGGRSRPFYNIVNYRVALAKTATDLDIKDIQIVADDPKHQVHSMLLNREAYEWMKREEFSRTLNDMGQTRPKYGGYLVKKCMEDGELDVDVVRWTNVWTDQNDILGGAIVETHHMSPVELKRKDDVWENVTDVLRAFKKEPNESSIEVREATGEFSEMIFKDSQGEEHTEEDEFTYSLQRYFIARVGGKDFLLYAEKLTGEMQDYYEYLEWEENGYGLGRGVIEDSEEAQVWTNDAVINEAIAMSLAGRVGIATNSKKIGNNILDHDHGKIYELGANETMTAFNLAPSALGQYQNQVEKWRMQADNVTSSFNAVTGEQPPSGTPLGTTQLLNQVATRPFDYKREEWGIHLTKIFDKWVIPYLVKKISKEHILVSDFSDEELDLIDESFAVSNSNPEIVDQVIKSLEEGTDAPTNDTQDALIDDWKKHIKRQGKKRYIEVPKDFFKDIECHTTVITTGEQKNKAAILQSLNEMLKTVIGSFNPNTGTFGVLEDPTLRKIFDSQVELAGAGVSPVSFGRAKSTAVPQAPMNPAPAPTQQTVTA